MEEQKNTQLSLDQKVDNLTDAVADLTTVVKGNTESIADLKTMVKGNTESIADLKTMVKGNTQNIVDLTQNMSDLFSFLQEHMVTKEEAKQFATKEDLKKSVLELKLEMNGGFRMLEAEIKDIRKCLERLEKKVHEDDTAMVEEITKMKKRLVLVETDMQEWKKEHGIYNT